MQHQEQAARAASPTRAVPGGNRGRRITGDAARKAVDDLRKPLPPAAGPQLAAAAEALNRLTTTNAEIVALSRRNSNVRSLALSLGRKRALTAECDDQLRALEEALARHDFNASR